MQRYMRSNSLVSRVIAGETLIVPVRKGVGDLASIYSLNEVASSVWHSVAVPRSREEIVEGVRNEFAADPDQIERDVTSFLDEMQALGLITSAGVAD